MDQDVIKHDHAVSAWIRLRVARDGTTTTILMIETDLSLNAEDPDYRKAAVKSLIKAVVAYVRDHPLVDTTEIEQLRQGSLDVTSLGD